MTPCTPKEGARVPWTPALAALLLWALRLAALPLFPSQDGPSHLATGRILFDCLAGREPAASFYSWRPEVLTNQLCSFLLGGLLVAGVPPPAAEAVLQLALLAPLLVAGRRLLAACGASPWALLLLLLPFGGQVLHFGYYNCLASVTLALAGWTAARRGRGRILPHVFFAAALYAHIFGAATFLCLAGAEALLDRRPERLLRWLPHLAAFALAAAGHSGGRPAWMAPVLPDFFGAQWTVRTSGGEPVLRFALLAVLGAGLLAVRRDPRPAAGAARKRLALLALPFLLASGLAPDQMEYAVGLRPRFGLVAWCLLLPALAPPARVRRLGAIALGLAVALLAAGFARDRSLARRLRAVLASWPPAPAGETVLAAFDVYEPASWFLANGFEPAFAFHPRARGLVANQRAIVFNPWIHLPDRWALEGGAVTVANHQSFFPQSPIAHVSPPRPAWRRALTYSCGRLPLAGIRGAAAAILLANLPPGWLAAHAARLPPGLAVAAAGPDWVLLATHPRPRPSAARTAPIFRRELRRFPVPWRPAGRGPRVAAPAALVEALAGTPFTVFTVDPKLHRFRPARPDEASPREGILDRRAAFSFRRFEPPAGAELWLVPR